MCTGIHPVYLFFYQNQTVSQINIGIKEHNWMFIALHCFHLIFSAFKSSKELHCSFNIVKDFVDYIMNTYRPHA